MNFTMKVDEGKIQRVKKYMDNDRFRSLFSDRLQQIGDDLKADIQENIAKRASNTGQLLQSWFARKEVQLKVVVGTPNEYALFVEEGTRPHRMPIDPLIGWVRRKRKDLGISFAETNSTAWAVWWKIARKGTKAKKYMEDALKKFNLNAYLDALLKEWENV